jgi:hypothetical protein
MPERGDFYVCTVTSQFTQEQKSIIVIMIHRSGNTAEICKEKNYTTNIFTFSVSNLMLNARLKYEKLFPETGGFMIAIPDRTRTQGSIVPSARKISPLRSRSGRRE